MKEFKPETLQQTVHSECVQHYYGLSMIFQPVVVCLVGVAKDIWHALHATKTIVHVE